MKPAILSKTTAITSLYEIGYSDAGFKAQTYSNQS
jgi:hypothetical protein